ncbi:unnamed protein product [Cyprideis torosa]|uniref:Uncharacterized protein n=1 Tax=Cyprideis torosa TaxID=163714 RepID=A0A7R8ZV19_9CRUS|nr:unnamed protein product [Cyprideis torosa]CAG0901569.1 unnamed protein product [Cyprideis torosa]
MAGVEDFNPHFDSSTTALEVLEGLDLTGVRVFITGGNCGLGFETVRALALHGAHVFLGCRDTETGQKAVREIEREQEGIKCEVIQCDLSRLASVRHAALSLRNRLNERKLDVLILNAGVSLRPFEVTEDGFEMTYQVNHLAHMYLTLLLSPLLERGSRIVSLASGAHQWSTFGEELSEEDISPTSPTTAIGPMWYKEAYGNTKLLNILMTNVLHHRWFQSRGILANAVNPGEMIHSNLTRNSWIVWLSSLALRLFTRNLEQGAATTVLVAVSPDTAGVSGCYFENCNIKTQDSSSKTPSAAAQNLELAALAWKLSMRLLVKATKGTIPQIPDEFLKDGMSGF